MTDTTRAMFLRRAGAGSLALVAGGTVLGLAEGSALAATSMGDIEILKLAATAELLAINFYTTAIKSKKVPGEQAAYFAGALANEKAHYAALAEAIGSGAPTGLKFAYPKNSFKSGTSIGKLGEALETAFVGAYMGAVTALESNDLKGVAAEIGSCESRHLSVLTNLGHGSIVPPPALPKVLSATQAGEALKPFIVSS
jgi:hypothetical protein